MNILTETPRLTLRQLTLEDAPFILELVTTPSWLKYIGDRGVYDIESAHTYIQTGPITSYQKFGFGLWLVTLKNTNQGIGMCGLLKRDSLEDPDIGFALLPEYEGKGYAFEAATAVLDYAQQICKLKQILAIVLANNQRSISLLKRLGFTFGDTIKLPFSEDELLLFNRQMFQ